MSIDVSRVGSCCFCSVGIDAREGRLGLGDCRLAVVEVALSFVQAIQIQQSVSAIVGGDATRVVVVVVVVVGSCSTVYICRLIGAVVVVLILNAEFVDIEFGGIGGGSLSVPT